MPAEPARKLDAAGANAGTGNTLQARIISELKLRRGKPKLRVVQGNPEAVPNPDAPKPNLKLMPRKPDVPLRTFPGAETEPEEEVPSKPSAYEKLMGAPVQSSQESADDDDDKEGGPDQVVSQPRRMNPIAAWRARRQQAKAQKAQDESALGQAENAAMAAIDELAPLERKEFIYGVFWPSFIAFPIINLVGWYFYWFITRIKPVPKAFRFAGWQKAVVIGATFLLGTLTVLALAVVADYMCTGATGILTKAVGNVLNFTTGNDFGIGDVCRQFKDVFQQIHLTQ